MKNDRAYFLPKQSFGEAVDKITILSRKIHFGEEEAYKEFIYLTEAITNLELVLTGAILASIIRLTQANFDIWNLENEMRKGREDKFTREEIGKRAIEIRDINRKRVNYKNELNRLTELGFREFKVRHRSQ